MTLSNLQKLSVADYQAAALKEIKFYEVQSSTFYVHADHKATIGYGFNIENGLLTGKQVVAVLKNVMGHVSTLQASGLALVEQYVDGHLKGHHLPLLDVGGGATRAFDYSLFAQMISRDPKTQAGTPAQRAALNSIQLTEPQQAQLLKIMLFDKSGLYPKSYDSQLTGLLASKSGGASTAIDPSVERVQLLSAVYNAGPYVVDFGVRWAINNDNRAYLWYEMRYHHPDLTKNGYQNTYRRFDESSKIGIVAKNHTLEDAAKALSYLFNAYTVNKSFEHIYSSINLEDRTYHFFNKASSHIPIAQRFEAQIAPLLKELQHGAEPFGYKQPIQFVQIVSPNNSTKGYDTIAHAGDALDSTGHKLAVTNNALFGSGLRDVLIAGKGQDLLVGGDGDDKYQNVGLGDVVVDTAGHDEIHFTANAYKSQAGIERYYYDGSDHLAFHITTPIEWFVLHSAADIYVDKAVATTIKVPEGPHSGSITVHLSSLKEIALVDVVGFVSGQDKWDFSKLHFDKVIAGPNNFFEQHAGVAPQETLDVLFLGIGNTTGATWDRVQAVDDDPKNNPGEHYHWNIVDGAGVYDGYRSDFIL